MRIYFSRKHSHTKHPLNQNLSQIDYPSLDENHFEKKIKNLTKNQSATHQRKHTLLINHVKRNFSQQHQTSDIEWNDKIRYTLLSPLMLLVYFSFQ